jgi:hypothetical protein
MKYSASFVVVVVAVCVFVKLIVGEFYIMLGRRIDELSGGRPVIKFPDLNNSKIDRLAFEKSALLAQSMQFNSIRTKSHTHPTHRFKSLRSERACVRVHLHTHVSNSFYSMPHEIPSVQCGQQ